MSFKRALPVFFVLACLLLAGCGQGIVAPEPTLEPTPEPESLPTVRFSEVQSSNQATLALDDGSFPDWVEVRNEGGEAADLTGFTLRCGDTDWLIGALTLEPGELRLLWCDGGEGADHAPFAISKSGETLTLLSPRGTEVDSVTAPALEADVSFARTAEGFAVTTLPTPGYANDEDGYRAFQDFGRTATGLVIGEAMVYNAWYLPVDGEYYDWVELTNTSAQPIELGGYCLSDKGKQRLLYPLPEGTLQPGESRVIFCEKDDEREGFAPFGLSSGGETLYLSRADGTLCDYVCLRDIPLGCSLGREEGRGGFFYFSAPTPGAGNSGGCRFTGTAPTALTPDGVYEDVDSVRVELAGEGEIHVTFDGSLPTADSPIYDGAITLTETGVVRAVSFREDCLPSEALSLSYILNEGHSLPVASLVGDPADLFGGNGLYDNPAESWERPGCLMLYENGESLRLDCGVKLHGATSRFAQEKKSLKLLFRDRYAGPLEADLFDNGVTEFDSILLRAAQEADQSTWMRDTLMHQLSLAAFPELPAQDYHYTILYINGVYWGIYNIREAHSAGHYARHYGYDVDTVSQWQDSWPRHSLPEEVYQFALTHDLSEEENYAYVASHIDEKSVAAWCIMQTYSGNFDFNSPNMRFYYSTEDEVLRYALVDLDLGMFDYGSFSKLFAWGYSYTELARMMMRNADFRMLLLDELKRAVEGPLSDENALALIDSLADELRPEIARDRERWGVGSFEDWERMVEHLREYIEMNQGRAANTVQLLRESGFVHGGEMDAVFPRH